MQNVSAAPNNHATMCVMGHSGSGKSSIIQHLSDATLGETKHLRNTSLWSTKLGATCLSILETTRGSVGRVVPALSHANFALVAVSALATEQQLQETAQFIKLACCLDVQSLVVAVTMMDATQPAYDQERFQTVSGAVIELATASNANPASWGPAISTIPVCSTVLAEGVNIRSQSTDHMTWCEVGCLLDAINALCARHAPPEHTDALRVLIRGGVVCKGLQRLLYCTLLSGKIEQDMQCRLVPGAHSVRVRSIHTHKGAVTQAAHGEHLSLQLDQPCSETHRLLSCDAVDAAMPVWSLVADICWFTERFSGHSYTPTNSDTPIVTVYTSRGRTGCRCVSFQPNDDDSQRSCRMVLEPLTPLCVEPFSTRPKLGKFVVIENNLVLGCGVVVSTKTVAPDHEREARSSEWHQLQYFPIWSARELFRTWFRTRKRLVKQGWLGWDGRSPYHPKAYHPKAPQTLKDAGPGPRGDLMCLMTMVEMDGAELQFASAALRADAQLAAVAVINRGSAFEFVSDALKSDRRLLKCAVQTYGQAIRWCSADLKDDQEIVAEAVQQDVRAFKHASERLRQSCELALMGCKPQLRDHELCILTELHTASASLFWNTRVLRAALQNTYYYH